MGGREINAESISKLRGSLEQRLLVGRQWGYIQRTYAGRQQRVRRELLSADHGHRARGVHVHAYRVVLLLLHEHDHFGKLVEQLLLLVSDLQPQHVLAFVQLHGILRGKTK